MIKSSISNSGVNEYDWITDCYHNRGNNRQEMAFTEYHRAMNILKQQHGAYKMLGLGLNASDIVGEEVTVACVDSHGTYVYLNMESVQNALHIRNKSIEWNICSNSLHYESLPMYSDLSFLYKEMLNMDKDLYIMVYNGDVDPGINVLGSEWFVDDLGLAEMSGYKWRQWFINDNDGKQCGGWTKNFQRLSFVTIRGAGHMVYIYFVYETKNMLLNILYSTTTGSSIQTGTSSKNV